MKGLAVAALAAFALVLVGVERPPGLSDVTEVRHWSYPDYTRVVIELDREVEIKSPPRRLHADAQAKRPERLYLDLEGVWVGRRFEQQMLVDDGLLDGIRIGQNTKAFRRCPFRPKKHFFRFFLMPAGSTLGAAIRTCMAL